MDKNEDISIKQNGGEDTQLQEEALAQKQSKRKRQFLLIGGVLALVILLAIIIPIAVIKSKQNKEENSLHEDRYAVAAVAARDSKSATPTTMFISQPTDSRFSAASLIMNSNQGGTNPPAYAHTVSPYSNLIRLKTLVPSTDPNSRIFVMGDLHGCLGEMNELLNLIQFKPKQDILILTGDLVFKGDESLEVIRRAIELGALCVRGNHDDKVVRLKSFEHKFGEEEMSPPEDIMPEGEVGDPLKFGNKHISIVQSMSLEEYNYLASCPMILDIPELNARVVHGGLDPAINDILDNDPWSVMNMREFDENNQPSKLKTSRFGGVDAKHWTEVYNKYDLPMVFYGHDASRGILAQNKTMGVDTGCVYGRMLTAIEIRSMKVSQVDCEARVVKKSDLDSIGSKGKQVSKKSYRDQDED